MTLYGYRWMIVSVHFEGIAIPGDLIEEGTQFYENKEDAISHGQRWYQEHGPWDICDTWPMKLIIKKERLQ